MSPIGPLYNHQMVENETNPQFLIYYSQTYRTDSVIKSENRCFLQPLNTKKIFDFKIYVAHTQMQ